MHQENFHRRRRLAISFEQLADGGRDFARGLQDDGAAVHFERGVKFEPQIFGERAVGMQHRIDDLYRAIRDRSDRRPRHRQREARRRAPMAGAQQSADIFSDAITRILPWMAESDAASAMPNKLPALAMGKSMAGTAIDAQSVSDGGCGSGKAAFGGT